jgi:hypothetical protein
LIVLTTIVFPVVAIAAGVAVIRALIKFVIEIQRDLRGERPR